MTGAKTTSSPAEENGVPAAVKRSNVSFVAARVSPSASFKSWADAVTIEERVQRTLRRGPKHETVRGHCASATRTARVARRDPARRPSPASARTSPPAPPVCAHYDVQMLGGVVLHKGTIAEMKTGEGKTLVATLAIYLNALTGPAASKSSPSTTTWPAATVPGGWGRSITRPRHHLRVDRSRHRPASSSTRAPW